MTVVLTMSAILFGVLAYKNLPVNDLPAVDYPVIQVQVGYPGATPETMANNVATPLERQFMQIPGLEIVTSSSSQGSATFTLQFDLNKSIDAAATDVQTAITQATGQLAARSAQPADAEQNESERSADQVHRAVSNSVTQAAALRLREHAGRAADEHCAGREPGAGVWHAVRGADQGRSIQARGARDDDGGSGERDQERHELSGRRAVRWPTRARFCFSRRGSLKRPRIQQSDHRLSRTARRFI